MLKGLVLNLEDRMVWNHHSNIPNSFRMLMIGASGSGKTCLLFNMLISSGFLEFQNLIIYTSTKNQQEYQLLYHGFSNGLSKENIASILLNQEQFKGVPIPILCKKFAETTKAKESDKITVMLTDKTNELIAPDKLDKTKKHLIIFDDCITVSNQKILTSFFVKGRHNNCNSIYLSQSYFDLDRMIRINSNILILFKLNQRNKADIYQSVVGTILDRNDFYSYADSVWSKKYNYIVIDREKETVYSDIFEVDSDED